MKSINQILQNDKELLNNPLVQELINYCTELEDSVIEYKQKEQNSFENTLIELVNELNDSVNQILIDDEEYRRFKEIDPVDFKNAIINLQTYLREFSRINKFYFK
jgi:HPt (histidine-containing phosphotransfer) domain-containing protein